VSEPRVTAVVLNYDGRHLLEIALPSLAAQRYRDFRTVVVDNGSTDDSRAWLAETWPTVEVVALAVNIGVTPALNVCVEAARGELVALLNNDIELDPGYLGELVAALDAHPRAGVAAAKLIDFHDRRRLDGAGDVFHWAGYAARRGQGELDRGQYDEARAIFGACGGAALYRRAAFAEVGLFDEQFEANLEDVDWSFRAQLAGHGSFYVPSAIAYHMGGATLGARLEGRTLYLNWRNALWTIAKNYPAGALVRHAPELIALQLKGLAKSLRDRQLGIWLAVWRDALRGLPSILRKRRAVQRSRRLGLRELERLVGDR
jgi:GT2 family glycosyltransferase